MKTFNLRIKEILIYLSLFLSRVNSGIKSNALNSLQVNCAAD